MTQTQKKFIGPVILNHVSGLWSNTIFSFKDEAAKYLTDKKKQHPGLDLENHTVAQAQVSVTFDGDKEIPEELTDKAIDQLLVDFSVSQEQLANHLRALQIKATMRQGAQPFKHRVSEFDDSGTTEILLSDCATNWEGHVYPSELGYDTDGNLVGIRIWGRVSKSSS